MSRNWRDEVLEPGEMSTDDIRAELRHDIAVYEEVRHPVSKWAMADRINVLTEEMDRRVKARGFEGSEGATPA